MNGLHIYACLDVLQQKRSSLLIAIQQLRDDLSRPSDFDLTLNESDRDVRNAAMQNLVEEIRILWVVESSLKAIEDGVYATCQLCQKDIPEKRLLAIPWSTHCTSCENLAVTRLKAPENRIQAASPIRIRQHFRAWIRRLFRPGSDLPARDHWPNTGRGWPT